MKYACAHAPRSNIPKKEKKRDWSPPECQSGSNSDIVMEKRWRPAAGRRPSPVIFLFYWEGKWKAQSGRFLITTLLFDFKLEPKQRKRTADKAGVINFCSPSSLSSSCWLEVAFLLAQQKRRRPPCTVCQTTSLVFIS